MSMLPDTPLAPEAQSLIDKLLPRINQRIEAALRTPVSILLWGPGIASTSPLARLRIGMRTDLRHAGHAAFFSEELCSSGSSQSIRLQQLAQAQEFDLVVSTPCTPGSIGEIHDFVADRRVSAKTIVFLNSEHINGYSPQSLEAISTVLSCRLDYYPNEDEVEIVRSATMEEVQRIREMKYIFAGRY